MNPLGDAIWEFPLFVPSLALSGINPRSKTFVTMSN
jgi:hypothetical protein